MKNTVLLITIFSAFLLSCRNERVTDPASEGEIPPLDGRASGNTEETKPAAIKDTIEIYKPRPGEVISSPLEIRGRAQGTWYFEGSFAIRLVDENGKEITVIPAEAQDDWMTTDWVPFEATLEFDTPASGDAYIVFEKANPSGLREHAGEFWVPVRIP